MPKYKEIYATLKSRILNDYYSKTNNKLPAETMFCEEFSCSRMTVKHALDLLVEEGLIYRRPKQGSFVMPQVNTDMNFDLLDKNLIGFTAVSKGMVQNKVVSFELRFSDEQVAHALNIAVDDPVYYICRVRLIREAPYILEQTYMPVSVIPGLTPDILNRSIYSYIENDLHLKLQSSKKIITAAKATPLDCRELLIEPTDPVLVVEQIAYLNTGVPFEYSFTHHRYDKFKFTSYAVRN